MNLVVLTVIVFPVIFALIELFTGVLVDKPRQGDRKFKVFLSGDSGEISKFPLDLSELRKEFKGKTYILDVEVMPPRILETNIGIDLCLGAIAANTAIVLNMLVSSNVIYTKSLRILAGTSPVIELFVLFIMITMVQTRKNDRNPWSNVRVAQLSNLLGVALLIVQFLIFGKVLAA